jgi:FtsP/CotA-like multicopper oxidase with cupredoxin domain
MVRAGHMASPEFPLHRRALLAGLGAAALCPAIPVAAQARQPLALQVRADRIRLRPGGPETPIWSLGTGDIRFKRGETVDVSFGNEQPAPALLNWRGIDGASAAEPMISRAPLAAGAKDTFQLPLRHAGTFLCDLHLQGGESKPARPRPLIVAETSPVAVDRDEVVLIEEWRMRADGTAVAPGLNTKETSIIHTINGQISLDISARTNSRLRLRFINGSQRTMLAVKLENLELMVMAIDGQPSEPFPARNGALVLAPGSRTDVFIDAVGSPGTTSAILLHDGKEARPVGKLTISGEAPIRPAPLPSAAPLPSNGLPVQLNLKNAQRFDLPLGGLQSNWVAPTEFATNDPLAFRAGRTIVLALTNPGPLPTVFQLHGHHFRLLDRLDDGWKPFWLDTLAVEPGQTQRIAFLAEYPGRYLIESVASDWASPRLVRWYSVA